jgi:hypothetical protein
MTAREKFTRGQRVRLTDYGEASFPRRRGATGVVIGFGRRGVGDALVRIRQDGRKTRESYHMDFWEPAVDA